MAGAVPYDLIKARLADEYAGLYAVFDFDEIVEDAPKGSAPFMALEEVPGTLEENAAIGNPDMNFLRETGDIIVHCFVRAAGSAGRRGSAIGREMADHVKAVMRLQGFLSDPGVPGVQPSDVVRIRFISGPTPQSFFAGLWTSVSLGLRYERHFSAPTAAQ